MSLFTTMQGIKFSQSRLIPDIKGVHVNPNTVFFFYRKRPEIMRSGLRFLWLFSNYAMYVFISPIPYSFCCSHICVVCDTLRIPKIPKIHTLYICIHSMKPCLLIGLIQNLNDFIIIFFGVNDILTHHICLASGTPKIELYDICPGNKTNEKKKPPPTSL